MQPSWPRSASATAQTFETQTFERLGLITWTLAQAPVAGLRRGPARTWVRGGAFIPSCALARQPPCRGKGLVRPYVHPAPAFTVSALLRSQHSGVHVAPQVMMITVLCLLVSFSQCTGSMYYSCRRAAAQRAQPKRGRDRGRTELSADHYRFDSEKNSRMSSPAYN